MSDDQAVDTTLDLAEGERLLADSKHPASTGVDTIRFQDWCIVNGEALVAALKAERERNVRLQEMLTKTEDMLLHRGNDIYGVGGLTETTEKLRADLARVESERDQLREQRDHYESEAEAYEKEATEMNRWGKRLQARIAELEAKLTVLVEAAKPFKQWYERHSPENSDNSGLSSWGTPSFGDLRRLAAAVEQAIDKEKVIE